MKLKKFHLFLPLLAASMAGAAPVIRNDATVNLNLAGAWEGGVLPAGGNIATWEAASALTNTTGGNLTWGGLDLSSASGAVTFSGGNTLLLDHTTDASTLFDAGADDFIWESGNFHINGAAGSTSSTATGATFAGSGTVTLDGGGTKNWSTNGTTNGVTNVTFTGTLKLRGSAIPAGGAPSGNWLAFGGGGGAASESGTLTQTGSFALDTGDADSCGSLILTHGWSGQFLKLNRLEGSGSIRSDWGISGGTQERGIELDQATDTVFSGSILAHQGTGAQRRNVTFVKKGTGTFVFTGGLGTSTASATGPASLNFDIQNGTFQLGDEVATPAYVGAGNWDAASTFTVGSGATLRFMPGSFFNWTRSLTGGNGNVEVFGDVAFSANSSSFAGNIEAMEGTLRIGPDLGSGTLTVKTGVEISPGLPSVNGISRVGALVLESGTESNFRLGSSNDGIEVNGALTPPESGVHTIHLSGAPTVGGAIKLIDFEGAPLTPEEFGRFELGFVPLGAATYQLVNNTEESSLDLVISLGEQLWKGDEEDPLWDDFTANWVLPEEPDNRRIYDPTRPVVFDDSADDFGVVVGPLAEIPPLNVRFESDLHDYFLFGDGIPGSTSVVKNGAAKVTLDQWGSNSYTGGTIINEGILSIGSGDSTGDIGFGPVEIGPDGTLLFDRDNVSMLDYKSAAKMRNVSGSGSIILDGGVRLFNYTGSTLGFTEANSWAGFSGNLIIRGGSEFQTIRNGATAMGTGNVVLGDAGSNGTLSGIEGNWTWTNNILLEGAENRILNRGDGTDRTYKLQGVISGSGGLVLQDTGGGMTNPNRGFILTGTNTMDGLLTIATGTPVRVGGVPGNADVTQAGAAASGSLGDATVVNNGSLTFSRTDAHTVGNEISGTGNLRIGIPAGPPLGDSSTQVLTYTGSATHTGSTTLLNGTLVIDSGASVGGSSITVEAAATLSGTGTVSGPLAVAGTIAPGTGIGTLPVTGNTTVTGTLSIEVNGTAVDKLLVTGNLDLVGSTVLVSQVDAGFTQESYVIAESTGTISGLPSAPSGYALQVVGNQLILSISDLSGFEAWAEANAGGQTAEEDYDGDGVPNGVEYFMGETGSSFTANPSVVTENGVRTVTWPHDPSAAASYKIQTSQTLAAGDWTDIVPPHASIDESDPTKVVFTLPETDKVFIRLSVTVDP